MGKASLAISCLKVVCWFARKKFLLVQNSMRGKRVHLVCVRVPWQLFWAMIYGGAKAALVSLKWRLLQEVGALKGQ